MELATRVLNERVRYITPFHINDKIKYVFKKSDINITFTQQ